MGDGMVVGKARASGGGLWAKRHNASVKFDMAFEGISGLSGRYQGHIFDVNGEIRSKG